MKSYILIPYILLTGMLLALSACGDSSSSNPKKPPVEEEAKDSDSPRKQNIDDPKSAIEPKNKEPEDKSSQDSNKSGSQENHDPQFSLITPWKNLKLASFNIREYGARYRNDLDRAQTRDAALKDFFDSHFSDTDIIALQEISDLARLSTVAAPEFNCHAYSRQFGSMQVALCVRKELKLVTPDFDNNLVIESVNLSSFGLRPAIHGIVQNSNGEELFYVTAVHLKAYPGEENTNKRLKQFSELVKSLHNVPKSLPIFILGDFNSFGSDIQEMHKTLDFNNIEVARVPGNYSYTYPGRQNLIDHIFVSTGLKSYVQRWETTTIAPCSERLPAEDFTFYKNWISDHCPVFIDLTLSD